MTRTARPTPLLFIDMQIVQIQVSVSEIGQVGCFLCHDQVFGVTAKTKLVIFLAKGRIKLGWILLCQKAEVLAAVCDMASTAVVFRNWTVEKFLAFKFVGKGRQNLVPAQVVRLVMAGQTQLGRRTFKYELDGRCMRRMTLQTTALLFYDAVFVFRILGTLFDVFMTWITHLRSFGTQQLPVVGTVRIVTTETLALGGFVDEFEFFHFSFCSDMTGNAYLFRRRCKKVLVIAAVRVVTYRALSDSYRAVKMLELGKVLVTFLTRFGNAVLFEQLLIAGCVRIMTLLAVTVF